MGHVRVSIQIANPSRRDLIVIVENALVDTGATRTTIPRSLAQQLDLEIVGQTVVRTAAGEHTLDQSYALIRYNGSLTYGDVWISDAYPGVLIGVITLESLGLAVDPGSGKLTPFEFLLL
jgi:clan AA aspartic protease